MPGSAEQQPNLLSTLNKEKEGAIFVTLDKTCDI